MEWSDEGIFLSAKPLGEANAVAEIFSLGHGRHLGLVRGGRSRRMRPLLQPGNLLRVTWRARLSEHLGGFNLEMTEALAARVLDNRLALAAIGSLTSLAKLLPERDPHPALYASTLGVLRGLDDPRSWPARLVRWEVQLLQELGFGLDLNQCAATGSERDLAFVSPRSGRAVSRSAGVPYGGKLLALPGFLLEDTLEATEDEVVAGLTLTGYFLEREVFAPQGLVLPQARDRLVALLSRTSKRPA